MMDTKGLLESMLADGKVIAENSINVAQQKLGVPDEPGTCLLYTSPSPRDRQKSRMPSSA